MPIFPSSSSNQTIRFRKTVTVANTADGQEYHNGLLDEFGFANTAAFSFATNGKVYFSGFASGNLDDSTDGTDYYDDGGNPSGFTKQYIVRVDNSKPAAKKYAILLRDSENDIDEDLTQQGSGIVVPEDGFYGDFRKAFAKGKWHLPEDDSADNRVFRHYTNGGLYSITHHANGVFDLNYLLKEKKSTFEHLLPGLVVDAGEVTRAEYYLQKTDVPRGGAIGETNMMFSKNYNTRTIPKIGNIVNVDGDTMKFSHFRDMGKHLEKWEIPALLYSLASSTSTNVNKARNDFVGNVRGFSTASTGTSIPMGIREQDTFTYSRTAHGFISSTTLDFGDRKDYIAHGHNYHQDKTRWTNYTTVVFHDCAGGYSSDSAQTQLDRHEFMHDLQINNFAEDTYSTAMQAQFLAAANNEPELFCGRNLRTDVTYFDDANESDRMASHRGFYAHKNDTNYGAGRNTNYNDHGWSKFAYIHLPMSFEHLAKMKFALDDGNTSKFNARNFFILPGKWEPVDFNNGVGDVNHYKKESLHVFDDSSDDTNGYKLQINTPVNYGDIVLNVNASDHGGGPSRSKPASEMLTNKSHQLASVDDLAFLGGIHINSGGARLRIQTVHDAEDHSRWGTSAGTHVSNVFRDDQRPDEAGGYGNTITFRKHSVDNQISIMRLVEP